MSNEELVPVNKLATKVDLSKQRALKSGLLSRDLLISTKQIKEKRADYNKLLSELIREYKPQGVVELLLVERIATGFWKVKRTTRLERDYFVGDEDGYVDYQFRGSVLLNMARLSSSIDKDIRKNIDKLEEIQRKRLKTKGSNDAKRD